MTHNREYYVRSVGCKKRVGKFVPVFVFYILGKRFVVHLTGTNVHNYGNNRVVVTESSDDRKT